MPTTKADPEYLTRSDIARILKISPKQAGRLMEQMPCVRVGAKVRRVARPDFDDWVDSKKLEEMYEAQARRDPRTPSSRMKEATALRLTPISSPGRAVRKPRPISM